MDQVRQRDRNGPAAGRLGALVVPLAAALAASPLPAPAAQRAKLAVFIENRSTAPLAQEEVAAALGPLLFGRGYEVEIGQEAQEFARESRVVHVEAPPAGFEKAAAKRFHADAVLVVTISFFLDGRARSIGPRAGAAVGLSARMLTPSGELAWRNVVGDVGETSPRGPPSEGAERKAIAADACERLLWTLPSGDVEEVAAATAPVPAIPGSPRRPPAPPSFDALVERHPELSSGPRFRLRIDRPAPDGGSQ